VCTLVLAWRLFPETPVAVAANRDEATDRPAEPPSVRRAGDAADGPWMLAPRDARAGGTWTGYSDRGVYAGLTNRWRTVAGGGERSRGRLVEDALASPDAERAVERVRAAVERHRYDGFALVVADATAAFLFEWDGRLRTSRLDPGVHVVVNVGAALGGGGVARDRFFVPEDRRTAAERQAEGARALRGALTPEPGESSTEWFDRAAVALGDHEFGVCVHGDGFGTRSSSLIAVGERPSYRFADGPPCETPHRPVDEQI
jgi:uncharacterized protein with NRDE domain